MIFVRYTYKNRRITTPQERPILGNPSNPLLGGVSTPEIYNALSYVLQLGYFSDHCERVARRL